jgi:hypothetical protein
MGMVQIETPYYQRANQTPFPFPGGIFHGDSLSSIRVVQVDQL